MLKLPAELVLIGARISRLSQENLINQPGYPQQGDAELEPTPVPYTNVGEEEKQSHIPLKILQLIDRRHEITV